MNKKVSASMPAMLQLGYKVLGYQTALTRLVNHSLILDKQVFCLDLLSAFENFPINSFDFHTQHEFVYEEKPSNSFELPIESHIYSVYVKNVIVKKDCTSTIPSTVLREKINDCFINFDNYISSSSHEKILCWIAQKAKEQNKNYTFMRNQTNPSKIENMSVTLDKDFCHLLCKEAYGENYTSLLSRIYENKLHNKSSEKKKNKI